MITSFANNMSPYGKILCVNRPICILTGLLVKTRKFIRCLRNNLGIKKISDNLYTITPFVLIHDQSALKSRILRSGNRKVLSHTLNKAIDKIGFDRRIRLSWVYVPSQVDYLGIAGDIGYIYECYDNYREFKFALMNRQQVIHYDRILSINALIVFNTALKLYEEKIKYNPNSYYIPNAVNLDLFSDAKTEKNAPPWDLKKILHPIVGFVGNAHASIVDVELTKHVASLNPSLSFVFLGKIQKSKEMDDLFGMPNVHYLGYKRYEDLPKYLFFFDAGIIPFKINEITKCLDPLKAYEFMAAGCPVVTTDIPEMRKFSSILNIAKNKEDFAKILREVLSQDTSDLAKALLAEARKHSWDQRTKEMISYIQDYLKKDMLSLS